MSSGPWLDRTARESADVLRRDVDAEVLVVGAGLSGAWIASRLAARGLDVVLLDGRRAGEGATGRSAGLVLADTSAPHAVVRFEHGEALAHTVRALGIASRDAIAAFAAKHDVGYRVTGSLRLAAHEAEAADLEATASLLGEPLAWLERSALPTPWDTTGGFEGGLLDPGDGVLDPVALVLALSAAGIAAGLRLFEASPVTALRRRRDRWRADTPRGSVLAQRVVLCTNAWSSRLVPSVGPVLPTRAQMLEARVTPDIPWSLPIYASRGGDYWRRTGPGSVIVGGRRRIGGREENVDVEAPSPKVQRSLEALLASIVPEGAEVEIVRRWAGVMGLTPDDLPVAGAVPGHDGVFVLAGLGGHGLTFAPAAAEWLAAQLADGGSARSVHFSPARFTYPPPP